MDITLDKKSATEASIKIKLNETDYQHKVEEKMKDYAKKANIKGFRPGKVPLGLIRKMYGTSIIVDEINHMLGHAVSDYVKDNSLNIIGQPLPNVEMAEKVDWENQKEFEFYYDLGLIDDFKYDVSKKQKVKGYIIEMDKKSMDETLDNLKKQFGTSTNPVVSDSGDSLFGQLAQKDGELRNETTLSINTITKKERQNFIGVKSNDVIEFDIDKAFGDASEFAVLLGISLEQAKVLKGKFTFTVKNVNRVEPAHMNQEFFDKVFGPGVVSSEKEFIEKVKETMNSNYKRETDLYLNNSIMKHFVNSVKMEVPNEFLKNWLLRSNEGKVTIEEIENEFEATVKTLKWDLIRNKIAEDNNIKVENGEVVDQAKSMILQQFGGAGIAEQLGDKMNEFADNYLKGNNGDNYMQVFNQVHTQKIMSFIRENITINDKKVSVDEFQEIAMN